VLADWRNFLNAVDKAMDSCKTTSESMYVHSVDITKTIPMPKGAEINSGNAML